MRGPQPFSYDNYRHFLKDRLTYLKEEEGRSFRRIAQEAELNSPNYLQRVAQGDRHLLPKSAAKVAKSIGLEGDAQLYFLLLIQLAQLDPSDQVEITKIQAEINCVHHRATQPVVKNDLIHDDWLLPVIWEMATLADFDLIPDNIAQKLKGMATLEQISHALSILVKNNHLIPHANLPHRYLQKQAFFVSSNDKNRMIRIQSNHTRYLDMAKHRINDSLEEREFQGLTIALSKDKMPLVKERIRQFMMNLANELSNDAEAEEIIRIQTAAFYVTR